MRRFLVVLALAGCAPWTKQDTALEAAFVGTVALDWHQTISITANCQESNPMIGRCGDVMPPNVYFPIAIAVHATIAALLPRTWRTAFQGFSAGLEVSTIYNNQEDGYQAL